MATMAELGFRVDTSGIEKGRSEIKKLRTAYGDSASSAERATKANKNFGGALSFIKTAAVIAGVSKLAQESAKYNTALKEVSTLVDTNKVSMSEMTAAIEDQAKQYGSSSTESAKAFYQAISAGAGTVAEATEVMNAANRLAIAGNTDVLTSVDGLTSAVNAYGESSEGFAATSDAIFTAVKFGKTTVDEMASSVGKLAPLANSAGVSFDEMAAATASLTAAGLSTSEAMTAQKAMLTSVIKPTKEASDVAAQLGIDFSTTAIESQGLAGWLQTVMEKSGGNVDTLGQLFGSVEGLNAVLALGGESAGHFSETLEAMANKTGATDAAFEKMASGPAFQFDKLMSNITVTMLSFGNDALTLVTPMLVWLNELIENGTSAFGRFEPFVLSVGEGLGLLADVASRAWTALTDMFEAIKPDEASQLGQAFRDIYNWIEPSVPIITAIVAGLAGIGATVGVITIIGGAIATVTAAVGALSAALLLNPITLTIAAIGAAAYVIYDNWDWITQWWSDLWASFGTTPEAVWEAIKLVFYTVPAEIIKTLIQFGADVFKFWSDIWSTFQDSPSEAWAKIEQTFIELPIKILAKLVQFGQDAVATVKEAMSGIPDAIEDALIGGPKAMYDAGVDTVSGFANGVADKAGDAVDAVKGMASSAVGGLTGLLRIQSPSRLMYELGEYTVEGFVNAIKDGEKEALKSGADFASSVGDGIESQALVVVEAVEGLSKKAVDALDDINEAQKVREIALNDGADAVNRYQLQQQGLTDEIIDGVIANEKYLAQQELVTKQVESATKAVADAQNDFDLYTLALTEGGDAAEYARLKQQGFTDELAAEKIAIDNANKNLEDRIALLQSYGIEAEYATDQTRSFIVAFGNGLEGVEFGGLDSGGIASSIGFAIADGIIAYQTSGQVAQQASEAQSTADAQAQAESAEQSGATSTATVGGTTPEGTDLGKYQAASNAVDAIVSPETIEKWGGNSEKAEQWGEGGEVVGAIIGAWFGGSAGAALGASIGKWLGELIGGAFGSGWEAFQSGYEITLDGLETNVRDVLTEKKQKSWYRGTEKRDIYTASDASTIATINNAWGEITDAINTQFSLLGVSGVSQIIENFAQEATKVTAKADEDLAEILTEFFQETAGRLASDVVAFDAATFDVTPLQQMLELQIGDLAAATGEEILEGVGEIFTAVVVIGDAFDMMGVNFGSVVNEFAYSFDQASGTLSVVGHSMSEAEENMILLNAAFGGAETSMTAMQAILEELAPSYVQQAVTITTLETQMYAFDQTLKDQGLSVIRSTDQLYQYIQVQDASTEAGRQNIVTATEMIETVVAMDDALAANKETLDAVTASTVALGLEFDAGGVGAQTFANMLVELSGGMDAFQTNVSSYYENFYSDEEQRLIALAAAGAEVQAFNDSIGKTGDATIDTIAEHRAHVESLQLLANAGDEAAAAELARALAVSESMAAIAANEQTLAELRESLPAEMISRWQGFYDLAIAESDEMFNTSNQFADEAEALAASLAITNGQVVDVDRVVELLNGTLDQNSNAWTELDAAVRASTAEVTNSYAAMDAEQTRAALNTVNTWNQAGQSIQQIAEQIRNFSASAANDARNAAQQSVAATTAAKTINNTPSITIDGSFSKGLDYVPRDGFIAELHKGERVLTAEENRNYGKTAVFSSNNSAANDELLQDIRDEMVKSRQANENLLMENNSLQRAIASNSYQTNATLEKTNRNNERVARKQAS